MKLFPAVACLSALCAPVAAFEDRRKVPGNNTLYHCPGDLASDAVEITNVDLSPNPPEKGRDLVITANGTFRNTIREDAQVHLTVKMGLLKIVDRFEDLCDQVGHVDLKCPIQKGSMTIVKTVSMPNFIPRGTFTVEADVQTGDKKPITCLQATVAFEPNGFFNVEL